MRLLLVFTLICLFAVAFAWPWDNNSGPKQGGVKGGKGDPRKGDGNHQRGGNGGPNRGKGKQNGNGRGNQNQEIKAHVKLTNFAGNTPKDGGYLDLVQKDGKLTITGKVKNLQPGGLHGFHVHEKGVTTNKCIDAGAHYNPNNKKHGGPSDSERHVGDLGNIQADGNGNANVEVKDSIALLNGEQSILNRAVIIHAQSDDLGKGNTPDSKKTGNAGARLMCGVIVEV